MDENRIASLGGGGREGVIEVGGGAEEGEMKRMRRLP